MTFDKVILVDEHDQETGVMDKLEAHQKGLLHRAFSILIFNEKGELLLQRRAVEKYHSGGLWSNTCCSHPQPGMSLKNAAELRLTQEMGIQTELSSNYKFLYKAEFRDHMTEYEYDHVLTGLYSGEITPDPAEVMDCKFMALRDLEKDMNLRPDMYTVWFRQALEGATTQAK